MSDKDIFSSASDQDTQNQTETNTAVQKVDTLPETVALLVGEGRKYKNVEDLAKAYLAADDFLEKLKGENATLREEVAKGATLNDVLKRLDGSQTQRPDKDDKTTSSGLSADDVAKIVQQQITGLETARTQAANLKKADAEMKTLFGDKAKEVFEKEASTPEMKKALMSLAAVSPEKFVALFKPQGGSGSTDSKTSVNTAAMNGTNASGRVADPQCKEFYDELRRKNPRSYYSSSIQLQMNKAAVANPNMFFNRGS